MPRDANRKWLMVNRGTQHHHERSTINYKQSFSTNKRAFSIIELLIVISLFGLAASLITAAYLTFERNQKVKNAALTLKNDIRLAQNKAHTGDKGPDSLCGFSAPHTKDVSLIGWYIVLSYPNSTSYSIMASCRYNSNINAYPDKTVTLPDGVTVNKISSQLGDSPATVNVLFQPLTSDARYYNGTLNLTPPFFDDAGKEIPGKEAFDPTSKLRIELNGAGGKYFVDIMPTGEVNESKQ